MIDEDLLDVLAFDEGMENYAKSFAALRAVIKLHTPLYTSCLESETGKVIEVLYCSKCQFLYPCEEIRLIRKELN